MTETIQREKYYISKIDGYRDRYLIEYPKDGVTGPFVIFLHTGLADADQGFCDNSLWCAQELRQEVMRRKGLYVSPDYRGDSWMNAAAEADLEGLIKELQEQFHTKQLVVTGNSMGGTSALVFAAHHQDMVDGVIALCPATDLCELWRDFKSREMLVYPTLADSITRAYGGTPDEIPEEYCRRSPVEQADRLTMPVVISHGDADDTLPVDHTRNLAEALKARGRRFRYYEISGGGHSAPIIATPWGEYLDFVLEANSNGE